MPTRHAFALTACILLLALPGGAGAQWGRSCSSDGVPRPAVLVERFISADCEPCWGREDAPAAARGELVLDWILPGQRGEDAPLAVAARAEGTARLQALGREGPAGVLRVRTPRTAPAMALRVSQGPALGDYIGAAISLERPGPGPWTAWLVLVEHIPAGADGTPVARNLVRAVFQPDWQRPPASAQAGRLHELRPLRIPENASAERLRLVGWVEDAQGRIRGLSHTVCRPDAPGR